MKTSVEQRPFEVDVEPKMIQIDGIDGVPIKDLQKLSDLFHAIEGTKSELALVIRNLEFNELEIGQMLAEFKELFWNCVFAQQLLEDSDERPLTKKRKFFYRKKASEQGSGGYGDFDFWKEKNKKRQKLKKRFYCLTCKQYHAVPF